MSSLVRREAVDCCFSYTASTYNIFWDALISSVCPSSDLFESNPNPPETHYLHSIVILHDVFHSLIFQWGDGSQFTWLLQKQSLFLILIFQLTSNNHAYRFKIAVCTWNKGFEVTNVHPRWLCCVQMSQWDRLYISTHTIPGTWIQSSEMQFRHCLLYRTAVLFYVTFEKVMWCHFSRANTRHLSRLNVWTLCRRLWAGEIVWNLFF